MPLQVVVFLLGVITVEFPGRLSLVTKCCRKQEEQLIRCNIGTSCRLKAARDLYGQQFLNMFLRVITVDENHIRPGQVLKLGCRRKTLGT